MKGLIRIEEATRPGGAARRGFALWQLGFRPFFLLASTFAALSIGLWALQLAGALGRPYLAGPLWHAHEMLFGFTLAVMVGFLLTAGRNWSARPTPSGARLAALAALWLAARVLVLTPFGWAAAIANTAFPLAAAVALAVPFIASGNRRNYFFVGLLVLMAGAVLAVHLSQLQVIELPGWLGIRVGLDVVLFVMAVMAGRVVPMFTNNGVPGANATRHAGVENAALGAVLALLLADALQLVGVPLALLLGLAAAAHLARWLLWRPWKTLHTPLVWVLHAAYLWIVVHLALRGAAALGGVAASTATHALTVGAVGGLVVGMMTRTTRGHTARPLRADRVDVACFGLVLAAALVRVVVPLLVPLLAPLLVPLFAPRLGPDATSIAVLGSAALWSAGFGLFALRYAPALMRPRVDGKPG